VLFQLSPLSWQGQWEWARPGRCFP
jgi:hypothetical protein